MAITGSGAIIAHDGDKTVQTIADRNALTKKFDGMEVTVLDSIADVRTGGGRACYKWFDSTGGWQLIWKDNRDNLIFTSESKTITNGQVTCTHPPQNGIVFDVAVIDLDGVEVGTLYGATANSSVISVGTADYDGFTLKFSYAYGAIEASISAVGGVTVTKTSQLENDSGFATTAQVSSAVAGLATTAQIADLVGLAPANLDTLKEIADQLTADEGAVSALTSVVSAKAPLDSPTFTGTVGGITKNMVGLGNVEDVALSTWAGSSAVTTLGTVTTGTWQGNVIPDAKLAPALTGKTYNGINLTKNTTGFSVAGGTTSKTLTVSNDITLASSSATNATLNIGTGGTLGTGAFATISNYATKASPTFTGTVTVPTAALGDNTTKAASTAFVVRAIGGKVDTASLATVATSGNYADLSNKPTIPTIPTLVSSFTNDSGYQTSSQVNSAIESVVGAAPAALNTLGELATALSNQQDAAAVIVSSLSEKAPLANPTFTGTVGGITKDMVGLGNVDNTPDLQKPISSATATALDGKENTILAGTVGQYYRGDKTMADLTASAVGLNHVDNTADIDKPISTATQTALDGKASVSSLSAVATSGNYADLSNAPANVSAFLNDAGYQTSADVNAAIATVVGAAPDALNTLKEIADQLSSDESAVSALTTTVASKAPLNNPTFTGIVGGITKDMVGLANVENTALSAWTGSSNITALGIVANGTWQGTAIEDSKIATALTGKSYNGVTPAAAATGFSIAGGTTSKTLTVSSSITLASSSSTNVTLNVGTGGTLGTGAFATISSYAKLLSPSFTGTPLAPTPASIDNSTRIATTAFVVTAISGKVNAASLAAVATSGSYTDLTNKPTIPTAVSALTNDSGYQTATDVNTAVQAIVGAAPAALDTLKEIADQLAIDESATAAIVNTLGTKQDALVSGETIKTINGQSILGSGDISTTSLATLHSFMVL